MSTEKTPNTEIAKKQLSQSERFTNMVMNEFANNAGDLTITSFQKKLVQNYFIKLDSVLKETDRKRMMKPENTRDLIAVTWENVNMQKLATDVIAFSSVGLDPAQPNHINIIPYKNNGTSKYDITFIMGYRGIELKAVKYGLNIPDDVTVELVYSNDLFRALKKNIGNRVESYEFDIKDPFDRGDIVGGFYYHFFKDMPEKNKLRIFSMKDIEKRKPDYASAEFWGGEKPIYKNGQKTNATEKIEGWFDEMCYKTIHRAAYNDITIDSEKIDEHFVKMMQIDEGRDIIGDRVQTEITNKANKTVMDFDDAEIVEPKQIEAPKEQEQQQPAAINAANDEGPGY